jgi:hypothetical protein
VVTSSDQSSDLQVKGFSCLGGSPEPAFRGSCVLRREGPDLVLRSTKLSDEPIFLPAHKVKVGDLTDFRYTPLTHTWSGTISIGIFVITVFLLFGTMDIGVLWTAALGGISGALSFLICELLAKVLTRIVPTLPLVVEDGGEEPTHVYLGVQGMRDPRHSLTPLLQD